MVRPGPKRTRADSVGMRFAAWVVLGLVVVACAELGYVPVPSVPATTTSTTAAESISTSTTAVSTTTSTTAAESISTSTTAVSTTTSTTAAESISTSTTAAAEPDIITVDLTTTTTTPTVPAAYPENGHEIWCRPLNAHDCWVIGGGEYGPGVTWSTKADPVSELFETRVELRSESGDHRLRMGCDEGRYSGWIVVVLDEPSFLYQDLGNVLGRGDPPTAPVVWRVDGGDIHEEVWRVHLSWFGGVTVQPGREGSVTVQAQYEWVQSLRSAETLAMRVWLTMPATVITAEREREVTATFRLGEFMHTPASFIARATPEGEEPAFSDPVARGGLERCSVTARLWH